MRLPEARRTEMGLRNLAGRRSTIAAATAVVAALAFPAGGVGEIRPAFKAPEVSGVSPNFGPAAGGNTVKISGEKFDGVTAVEFGTTEALSYTVNSSTSITATAPPHAAEKISVKVVTEFGPTEPKNCKMRKHELRQCTEAGPYKFKEPTVTGVTPGTGPTTGGTTVTLTGSGFGLGATETEIFIGKGVATSVECTSTTTCTAVTPPAAKPSTAYVKVTIHTDETTKTRKNRAVAFRYE